MKELTDKIALLEEQVKQFTEQVAAITKERGEAKAALEAKEKAFSEASATLEGIEKEKRAMAIEAKVKEFVEKKKIIPAQADKLKALIENLPSEKKFKLGDKDVSVEEALFEFLAEGSEVGLPTEPKTETGVPQGELDVKIQKYMEANGVSYKEAYVAVANEK